MTDQLTFFLPSVPVVLPDKPPAPKKKAPKRECPECGRPTKDLSGYLCAKCITRRPVSDEAKTRICGALRKSNSGCCPVGECSAIPY